MLRLIAVLLVLSLPSLCLPAEVTATTLLSDGFEAGGWSTAQVSGTDGVWSMYASGSFPAVTPHGGSMLAGFNSNTAVHDSQTRLYRTSSIAVPSSVANATLSFWMYHNTDWNDLNDQVQVQVSTNGTSWTNIGTPVNRYDGTTGWAQVSFDLSAYKGQSLRLGFVGISRYGNDIYLDDVTVTTLGGTGADFTLASPTAVTATQGGSALATISTTVTGSFNGVVALTATNLPTGATASFSPSSIAAPGFGSATLTLTAGTSTPPGSYSVTVIGTGSGITHTATIPFTVTTTPLPVASFAGIYTGNYSGADSGTVTVTLATTGSISGSGRSTVDPGYQFAISGQVAAGGNVSLQGSGSAGTATFIGTVTSQGLLAGTWSSGAIGSGTFSTNKTSATAQDFTLAAPTAVTAVRGGSSTASISTTVSSSFNAAVTLTANGLPRGAKATFSPKKIAAPGSGNATLKLTAGATTPSGTYSVTVTGKGGGVTRTATISLTVTDFTLTAPTAVTAVRGGSSTVTISTTGTSGFNNEVALTVSGVPAGATATFSPTSIATPGTGSTTLTLTTTASTRTGSYKVKVSGTGGGKILTSTILFKVTDFTLKAPTAVTAAQGGSGKANIKSTVTSGFNAEVALTASGVPPGGTAAFSPTLIAAPGFGSATLTLTADASTPAGTYPITVSGAGGGNTHAANLLFKVTPAPAASFAGGYSGTYSGADFGTITVTIATSGKISGNGRSTVDSSYQFAISGQVVAGGNVSLQGRGSAGTATYIGTITPQGLLAGTWSAGSFGGGTFTTQKQGAALVPDFTLAAPNAVTATQGGAASATLSTTISGGFNGAVALATTGVPTGATATISPTSISAPGSGSATLTLTAGASTPAGVYSVTITGTGGSKTHNATISFTVTVGGTVGTQMGGARQGLPLTLTGAVTTMAGNVNHPFLDGSGTAAGIGSSNAITTDGINLYVAESSHHRIRKIVISTGMVTTLAGPDNATCLAANGNCPSGNADGTGSAARFDAIFGITTDGTNLYATELTAVGFGTAQIRKIVIATGVVSTLPINPGPASPFRTLLGITTDGTNLFTTDGHSIRKIVIATNAVTTLAGSLGSGHDDGIGTAARFTYANGLTTDGTNLYVVETTSSRIRKVVIATGEVTTLAGPNSAMITAFNGFPTGSVDGTGTAARFYNPIDVTTDGTNLYVTDQNNDIIRKIVIATGVVSTLPGSEVYAGVALDGMNPLGGSFFNTTAITTDGRNLFVMDYYLILKIQ